MVAKSNILALIYTFYVTSGLQFVKGLEIDINKEVESAKNNTIPKISSEESLPSNATDLFPGPIVVIVGGGSVGIEQAPYIVSVQHRGNHSCGGAVLRNDVILTAAHCLIGYKVEDLTVRAGSISTSTGGTLVNVRSKLIYPSYTSRRKNGDIGLLWLDVPLKYSETIKAIELVAEGQEVKEGTIGFVTGWGYLKENGGEFPDSLQGVEVPIVSQESCNDAYDGKILPTMLCAGRIGGGKDACTYDSGGPLVHAHKLIGTVSWGRGCARAEYPGVYARLSTLRGWILDNMGTKPADM